LKISIFAKSFSLNDEPFLPKKEFII